MSDIPRPARTAAEVLVAPMLSVRGAAGGALALRAAAILTEHATFELAHLLPPGEAERLLQMVATLDRHAALGEAEATPFANARLRGESA